MAGTGDLGFNGEGLPAPLSWLYLPSAVLLDPERRLVIVDYNNMRVRHLDDARLVTIVGNGGHEYSTPGAEALATDLENPVDAAYGPDGLLHVLPAHESRLIQVDTSGLIQVVVGTGEEGYTGDGGPALGATLYQAQGFCFDSTGAIWIADTLNGAIRRVADGTIDTVLAGLGGPQRVRCGHGRVLATDTFSGRIIEFSEESLEFEVIAEGLSYPWSAVPTAEGWIAASSGSHEILDQDGVLAGSGEAGFSGDGDPALDAQLSWPADVFPVDDGFYVADMQNARVRFVRE